MIPKFTTKGLVRLDGGSLSLDEFERVARNSRPPRIALTVPARQQMRRSEALVRRMIASGDTVYGISTGFGRMADVKVSGQQSAALQRNLILSHAAGVGPPCTRSEVRGMMLLRLNLLAKGYSGARAVVADRLADFLNNDLCPVVPRHGSVGASGDLAPMAHVALALIGEGSVELVGHPTSAGSAHRRLGLTPLTLWGREGLALINGVQASTALLALAIIDIRRLIEAADLACAFTSLATGARRESFSPFLARVRPHPGHRQSAQRILAHLTAARSGSRPARVQDPYSIRCAPQVHGVCREALTHAAQTCVIEMNAATDNPLAVPDQDRFVPGGNFHGAPIGHAADHLAAVLADVASIGERRVAILMDPVFNRATQFLVPKGGEGLHSGLMMWQVTAASLVSEMKTLAHPAAVDSIPTSLGQEDHVSMSMWAADKLRRAVERWRIVLAVEALAAWRALTITGNPPRGGDLGRLAGTIRRIHGPRFDDRPLGGVIEDVALSLEGTIEKSVRAILSGKG